MADVKEKRTSEMLDELATQVGSEEELTVVLRQLSKGFD